MVKVDITQLQSDAVLFLTIFLLFTLGGTGPGGIYGGTNGLLFLTMLLLFLGSDGF